MIRKQDFKRIGDYLWELPKDYRHDMRVPARIYADDALLEEALRDKSIEQLVNTATLPGIVNYTMVMPDVHQGYGFPIGGVAATKMPSGIVSPGGVGYDINCGVRLLTTNLMQAEVHPHIDKLATTLHQNCPSGVGSEGHVPLSVRQLDEVLVKGSKWALEQGYAKPEDLEHTEERGMMPGADPEKISKRAKDRGKAQLGTLGAGNHFIEVDEVTEVFDAGIADKMGLFPGQIVVQVHCGSRGFGHQVCTDYVSQFQKVAHKYGIVLPDRELVCAPLDSPEGQDYLAAMACAANYAFANRQILAHYIRESFEEVFADKVKNWQVRQIYDIAHNMAKIETHTIDGKPTKVCVHRKGATRAFGPGHPALPSDYREIGQPVLVPGSMGTSSFVLVGTAGSMAQSFGSTCHGAGRTMSRHAAKKQVRGDQLRADLESQGITVRAGSMGDFAEEAPVAYKDVDRVVNVVHGAGIARKVVRLEPIAIVKG